MVLRMSVQEEHGRAFARPRAVDGNTRLGGDVEALESGKEIALCQIMLPMVSGRRRVQFRPLALDPAIRPIGRRSRWPRRCL